LLIGECNITFKKVKILNFYQNCHHGVTSFCITLQKPFTNCVPSPQVDVGSFWDDVTGSSTYSAVGSGIYCGAGAFADSWADSTVDVIIDSTERVIFSLATDSMGRVVSDILSATSVSTSGKITVSII